MHIVYLESINTKKLQTELQKYVRRILFKRFSQILSIKYVGNRRKTKSQFVKPVKFRQIILNLFCLLQVLHHKLYQMCFKFQIYSFPLSTIAHIDSARITYIILTW